LIACLITGFGNGAEGFVLVVFERKGQLKGLIF